MSAVLHRHRLTVDEFYKMAEVGILTDRDRVELIEGEIIDMSPMGPLHAGVGDWLEEALHAALAGRNVVLRVQKPLRLDSITELEPDIALVERESDYYRRRHPEPADTLLVIEISDTSVAKDREVKLPLYATHEIPEVWIVNLAQARLERFRQPQPKEQCYARCDLFEQGAIAPEAFPDAAIDLTGFLA